MDRFAYAVQGVVQFLSEAIEREWRTLEERRFHSQLQGPRFDLVGNWLEQFAGHEIWSNAHVRREEVLRYARGVREELGVVLGQIEPPCAMAVLCGLPAAQSLGYAPARLAASLGVADAQVLAWEQAGYLQIRAVLSERTPLLAFLHAQALEQQAEPEAAPVPETLERLLVEASTNPDFDLRRYVKPAVELRIRQWFHKWGMESEYREEDRVAVALVQERMKLELIEREEETEDA
ncbi:hypothetical protein [Tumebacillus permanentifrigoris]|uniref:Uncharacterized protein n=1 Tax=Tumebacillus permanentifrigoris TaxID=378543 RepID=A0A316D8U7_9BACL|nr:hypothetical protein [Tumebacillus permanentifrigoris]PWK13412.1 hypothetical protein C7459_10779 [Tumebacillus permanentifrigoris]